MMRYKSPIECYVEQLRMQAEKIIEDDVYSAVQRLEIHVDKEELLKALKYDRDQYNKGYADAKLDADIRLNEELHKQFNAYATNTKVLTDGWLRQRQELEEEILRLREENDALRSYQRQNEVVKEIFAEIERLLSSNQSGDFRGDSIEWFDYFDPHLAEDIAELKKKYIQD